MKQITYTKITERGCELQNKIINDYDVDEFMEELEYNGIMEINDYNQEEDV
jgi:hypothetical protein